MLVILTDCSIADPMEEPRMKEAQGSGQDNIVWPSLGKEYGGYHFLLFPIPGNLWIVDVKMAFMWENALSPTSLWY